MISIQVSLDYPLQIRNTESQQRAQKRVRGSRKLLLFHCSSCRLKGCMCYAQVTKSPNDHQGADIRCKSKRVFITKLELGLPLLPGQRLRRGAPNCGLHCLYRVFSLEKFKKWEFLGWETSNWLPSVEGLGVGF